MKRLLPLLLLCACGDERLIAIPPDAGSPRAEAGTRWREPLPEPEPDPPDCGLEIVWPLPTAPEGDCRPGWLDTCTGEGDPPVLPTPTDLNCDGIGDDDCAPWAMVLVVDGSGSMDPYRAPVNNALCALDGRGDANRSLVVFGAGYPDHAQSVATWGAPLCGQLPRTSGAEWAGEAAVLSPELVGGWPVGHARMLILVTDEPPQSSPSIGQDDGTQHLMTACLEGGYRVGVITKTAYLPRWQQVVDQCGGWVTQLNSSPLYPMSGAEPPCVEE